MIRFLDGLVLLKEVDEVDGISYNSQQLRMMHPDKVVVMRHAAYIYRDTLCDTTIAGTTNLDDYILMGELAEHLHIEKDLIHKRIDFMRKTGAKFFEYAVICGIYFIKIDAEFKYLFQNYQPFLAGFSDVNNVLHCKILGDLKIGFY